MADPIKVVVSDPETGEVLEERILDNDYMLLCAGTRYLHGVQTFGNSTHVLTVKTAPTAPCPAIETEKHDQENRCCPEHKTHTTPHRGCILR